MARIILSYMFMAIASAMFPARATEAALTQLDAAILQATEADSAYLRRLDTIKARIPEAQADTMRLYQLNKTIFGQYQFFKADSALTYINRNMAIAEKLEDQALIWECILQKADILARSGMFYLSMRMLDDVKMPLPDHLRPDYYLLNYSISQFAQEYAKDSEFEDFFFKRKLAYADSIMQVSLPTDFNYRSVHAALLLERDGDTDGAERYVKDVVADYRSGTRQYSILMSQLAFINGKTGDIGEQTRALALSAASDISGCIKENMAMRMLSDVLLSTGDVERASRCVNKSLEDANFYCARLRHTQSAEVLPLVVAANENLQTNRQAMMYYVLALLVFVVTIIVVSYIIIRRKNRELGIRNIALQQAREESLNAADRLNSAYSQLEETNGGLRRAQAKLEEANKVQQVYLSQFIWLCSSAINKIDLYRRRLHTLLRTNKKDELKDALTSTKEFNDMSADFYSAFDEAFLAIVPDFIDRLNTLLTSPLAMRSDAPSGQLTTEQRIFALMCLGIADNKKIADFLHCTISTVYTYRSKVKAKAKNPDRFESEVMELTTAR